MRRLRRIIDAMALWRLRVLTGREAWDKARAELRSLLRGRR